MKPDKTIEIISEKYGITGVIKDYGVVTTLTFSHGGTQRTIGISKSLNEPLADKGLQVMETTIAHLIARPELVYLHYWYLAEIDGKRIGFGIVTGHPNITDTTSIHTSPITEIRVDVEHEELLLTTEDTLYHCPLAYCRFEKQDEAPALLPDYAALKAQYSDRIPYPAIEPGKVLLELSDFDSYYFHSLYVCGTDGKPLQYRAFPHVGMFQDSFLVWSEDHSVDLRYFPHFRNIRFYSSKTNVMPLYAENIGMNAITLKLGELYFRLEPGERTELTADNAVEKLADLPDGDLYPAGT